MTGLFAKWDMNVNACQWNSFYFANITTCFAPLIRSIQIVFILAMCTCQITLAQDSNVLIWEISEDKKLFSKSFLSSTDRSSFLDSMVTAKVNDGYLSAFWDQELRRDTLFAVLDLGPKIETVTIRTDNVPSNFKPGQSTDHKSFLEYSNWSQEVLNNAEDQGYPFASLEMDSVERRGSSLEGSLNFQSGPLIIWDTVRVQGESRTTSKYLQNLSFLKVGEPFSQSEFEKASILISRSPYFNLIKNPELSFQQRKARAVFTLRDRKANRLDGVIGILPNENEQGKVLITGQLDLELYHLGGKGRDIEVHWQRLNIETQSLSLGYRESFLFGSPLSTRLGFDLLKQDTTFLNRNFILSFDYSPRPNLNLTFFTIREASDLISTSGLSEVTELPDAADFRWNQYGVGFHWNTLDSHILPRTGWRILSNFSAGNKRIIQNTAIPEEIYNSIDLNTAQYAISGSVEKYIGVKSSWGMWIRSSFGWIENENLLLNDLFRVGGLKSIRGFNENFFYARSFGYLNFEQRLFFGDQSYLLAFIDGGIIQNPFSQESQDTPFSLGTGLNLNTGNGLFKFILGVGSSNEQPFALSYARIHFGYVATF